MSFGQRCSEVVSWGDIYCDKQTVYHADNQPTDPSCQILRGT